MSRIPRDPAHCQYCLTAKGAWRERPCDDHALPDGSRGEYSGPDIYEPSDFVKGVVGNLYTAGRWGCGKPGQDPLMLVEVFGYDRRCGFWVREVRVLPDGNREIVENGYFSNISERAIDRTYHPWRGESLKTGLMEKKEARADQ